MEIFSEEFKNQLSKQLQQITTGVEKENPDVMLNEQLIEAMEDSFKNPYGRKKEKKKKNKKFKVGDVVYWGNVEGIVEETIKYSSFITIYVIFKSSGDEIEFTEDGRYTPQLPVVLSHFPYELKMKKIK